MRIHCWKIFLLLALCPYLALADTASYDYASRTPGENIFAYSGNATTKPATLLTTPTNQLNAINYSRIASDDGIDSSIQSSNNNSYASQRFVITIDQSRASVSAMTINWKGRGENTRNNREDGATLYIWNYSNSEYEQIGDTGDTAVLSELTKTFNADISNYIAGNDNKTITLYVSANATANGNNQFNLIATDFISVTITFTPALPSSEYRFDELQYNDVENEVIDSIGNLHGRAKVVQPTQGKVCNAVDLLPTGTSDYVILNANTLDNKEDFSISLWAKTAKTTSQGILSGASVGSNNDLLMWFTRSTSFRPFLKNTSNGALTVPSIADNTWQHLVWTRSGDQSCLYINKEFQGCRTQSTNNLRISSLIMGQEQDSVGGGFSSAQAFNGLIDELLVFDQAISPDEIAQIYDNQDAGLGYDGSTRNCPLSSPLLEYRFEEDSWNGTAGEILDNTGNNHHARVNNNAIPETTTPALTGNPGTCGYASLNDGSIEVAGLPLDATTVGIKTTATFWMNWDGSNSVMPIGWFLHDIWIFSGSMGFNTSQGDIYGISSAGLANGWHHVAVEFTNGSVTSNRMYIDGEERVLTQQRNTPNNNRAFVSDALRIGGWNANDGYQFHGLIDEVRIYQSALSRAQINSIMQERHACDDAIDHYQIVHDGQGLTCNSETVTINACLDTDCSRLSDATITLDLQATDNALQTTTKTSVTLNNGTASVAFNHFNAETLTLSTANESILAINNNLCSGASGTSCAITFLDSGFIFDVPTQTSCETSEEVLISAVRKDTDTLQCTPGFANTTKALNFTFNYQAPATGEQGMLLQQNGVDYALTNNQATPVDILFDANGQATFKVNYADAGRLTLDASYTASDSSNSNDLNMFGTDIFVTVPATLVIASSDNNANCESGDATCSVFKAAGDDFNLSVSATCANDASSITPNFQMNDIQLSINEVAPQLGNPVALKIAEVDIVDADDGIHTDSTQSISEVGVFTVTATPSNLYFNETIAPATSANIGRFVPAYFELDKVSDGSLSGAPFVYTGQMTSTTSGIGSISYLTLPEFTITAKSFADSTTLNYTGDFMKLLLSSVERKLPTQDASQLGADNTNKVDLRAVFNNPVQEEFTPGVIKYQFNSSDNYVYTRNNNAFIAPFNAQIDLQITAIIDSDDVQAKDSDGNATDGVLTLHPEGTEIRFGRWIMENSYGSETVAQRVPMQTQYWNGSYFTTSIDDNVSNFVASDASISANNLLPTSPAPTLSGLGVVINGESNNLQVSSPGINIRGPVTVELDVPTWLRFDWNGDGAYDNNPSAQVYFGLYRGNDRIIYRQELFE